MHPTSISVPAITAATGLCATMSRPPAPQRPRLLVGSVAQETASK
ncbi:hypothetical protein [Streptomyces pseudogriseolus]